MHTSGKRLPDYVPVIFLVLLSAPIIFYRLGSYGLVNMDEGLFQHVSSTMLRTHHWLSYDTMGQQSPLGPLMNGPLILYVKALLIRLFGDNYWTMRLPSAVFGLCSVLMTFHFTRYLADRRAAFLAALAQLTTWQFVYWHSARTGELETLVLFLFTLSAYRFARAIDTHCGFVGHHLCLALLANLKLPIAILPVLAELLFFAATPDARPRMREWARQGIIALPLALIWPLYLVCAQADRFWPSVYTMLTQTVSSSNVHLQRYDHRLGNAWYYARTLLVGAFPYSLAYPAAIAFVVRERAAGKRRAGRVIALFYLLAVFVFYAVIARRCPWYIMPVYPFASACLGIWLAHVLSDAPGLKMHVALAIIVAIVLLLRIETLDLNPFAQYAALLDIGISVRATFGLSPWVATLVLGTVASLLLLMGERLLRTRWPRLFAAACAVILWVVAVTRIGYALRYTIDTSEVTSAQRRVADAKQHKRPLPERFSIPNVHELYDFKLEYLFGNDYRVVPERPDGSRTVTLLRKSDPHPIEAKP